MRVIRKVAQGKFQTVADGVDMVGASMLLLQIVNVAVRGSPDLGTIGIRLPYRCDSHTNDRVKGDVGLACFKAANLESEETALLWVCGMPIGVSIITALFLYPATIRRARCFGSPVLGYLAVAFNGVGAFGLCVVFCCGVCEIELSEASFTLYGILLLFYPVSLALFLILLCAGGLYSGRKTELMRAAICGDLLRVRQLLAQDPDGVFTLSETGRSARQYAEMAGQPGIARLLADHEALAAERAEQEQG